MGVKPMACVKLNITLQEELLNSIDEYVTKNGMTRSGFLAMAAKQYLTAASMSPALQGMMKNLSDLMQGVIDGSVPVPAVNDKLTELDQTYNQMRQQTSFDDFR